LKPRETPVIIIQKVSRTMAGRRNCSSDPAPVSIVYFCLDVKSNWSTLFPLSGSIIPNGYMRAAFGIIALRQNMWYRELRTLIISSRRSSCQLKGFGDKCGQLTVEIIG